MTYPLLFLFALAPSFIWLAFYLRKDAHPEPNRMILKVFFFGMCAAVPAIWIETFLEGLFSAFSLSRVVFLFAYFLFAVAFVEEFLKYLVVRIWALSNKALDEPVDVMVYMIVAALGFAALENIVLLFGLIQTYHISEVFFVNAVRFTEAVFLHALASGLFGYFLALSFLYQKRRIALSFLGLAGAVVLHGMFNFYIFIIGGQSIFLLLLPIAPLLGVAAFISFGFRKLKNKAPRAA